MNVGKQLIDKIINDKDISKVLEIGINGDYFDEKYADIFDFVVKHYTEYGEVPTDAIMKNKKDYAVSNVEEGMTYCLDELRDNRRKDILEVGIDVARKQIAKNSEEALETIQTMLSVVYDDSTESRDRNVTDKDYIQSRYERFIERGKVSGIDGYSTGFEFIDNAMYGIHKEEFIVIASRQAIGKSFFSMIMATNNWKENLKVLFLTKEMSIDQMSDRFDSIVAKLGYGSFRKGLTDEEFLIDKYKEIANGREFIIGTLIGGVSGVVAKIQQHRPDIVYIDGFYLMEDEKRASARWEKMTNLTRDLKAVAQRFKLPILGTTQMGRGAVGEELDLSHLSYSDSIGQDADAVIGLYQTDEMKRNKEMGIKLLKVREGQAVAGLIEWDLDAMSFNYVGEDENETEPTDDEDIPF